MSLLHAFLFGIVEGITEFLPISSTAHLILTARALGLYQDDFIKTFEVAIQLGAILSIVVLYWRRLVQSKAVFLRVCIAFLPIAVIGLLLHKVIKNYLFESLHLVIASLFIGGLIIIAFEYLHDEKRATVSEMNTIPLFTAALIGVFQSIALIPGVSRSAATIIGGMALGLTRRTIVDFTFLLAIPTMLAATLLDLFQSVEQFSSDRSFALAVGFITSFVVALLAVQWFIAYIQRHSFSVFGAYRIIIALLAAWLFLP